MFFISMYSIVCRSDYAIFCTRMDFTKMIVMSLDFADVKNNENMSKGDRCLSMFYIK